MKLNLKKTALVTGLISSVAVVGLANAGNYTQSRIDYARVIHVKPITKTVETSTPIEKCWDEQVAHRKPRHHNNGYIHKNEAFGALIGAVVANQAAKRSSNRKAVTAAGAVIGTMIGNDVKKKNQRNHYDDQYTSYRTVKQCHVEHQVSYTEQVVAYKVRYKYRGKEYTTRMNNHPGDRIKVSVSVTPVEY